MWWGTLRASMPGWSCSPRAWPSTYRGGMVADARLTYAGLRRRPPAWRPRASRAWTPGWGGGGGRRAGIGAARRYVGCRSRQSAAGRLVALYRTLRDTGLLPSALNVLLYEVGWRPRPAVPGRWPPASPSLHLPVGVRQVSTLSTAASSCRELPQALASARFAGHLRPHQQVRAASGSLRRTRRRAWSAGDQPSALWRCKHRRRLPS